MSEQRRAARRGEVHELALDSEATGRRMTILVITPPGAAPAAAPLPVLYFLHPWGLSPRYVVDKLRLPGHLWRGIEAGTLPAFIAAVPEGGKSFYVNALDPPGCDWSQIVQSDPAFFAGALEQYGCYGDYLLHEAIPAVEQRFGARGDRAGRAIGGLSMGGAAAAYHAFRDPGAFGAMGMHSPAVFREPGSRTAPWIFGQTRATFALYNPADLARKVTPETQPRIWLDCGERDPLRENVDHLHRALVAQGLAHDFSVCPGGHDKTYWEPRLPEYLMFYARDWRAG